MLSADEIARFRKAQETLSRLKEPPPELARINQLLVEQDAYERARPWSKYRDDPVGYAYNVLGIKFLTPDQISILRALLKPPFMVKVDSGNSLGKSFISAVAVNWWYDSFDPGVILTTAPSYKHVVDVLWSEIRILRSRALMKLPMDFIGPRAPEMRSSEEHTATGLTADKGENFKGRHRPRMLFVFDEDEALPQLYYDTTRTMFKPNEGHAWLSIGNPSTTSSPAYMESTRLDSNGKPMWKCFRMSGLNHPNITAELAGQPPPVPNAVSLAMVDGWVERLCTPLTDDEHLVTDFLWQGVWRRPGPEGETVILGRRPSQGTTGVWSEALFASCESLSVPFQMDEYPELGVDVARILGGDDCDIHGRWGATSLVHDSANGRSIPATVARIKEMCDDLCTLANAQREEAIANGSPLFYPHRVPVKIDDCGIGGAVIDLADGYNFIPVNAGSKANADMKYPNKRSELWFDLVDRAYMGLLSFAHLEDDVRRLLKIQLMSPKWDQDAGRRRRVEDKELTKKRLGRSPDAADAINLAYYHPAGLVAAWVDKVYDGPKGETMGTRVGLLGRGPNATLPDKNQGSREKAAGKKVKLWGRQ